MEKRTLPAKLSFENLFGERQPGILGEGKYPYFSDYKKRPFQPKASQFELTNALWSAECSLLVYVRDARVVEKVLADVGFKVKTFNFDKPGSQCFVAHNNSTIIVCFRGTEVKEPRDVWNDIKFIPVESDQECKPGPNNRTRKGGKIHKGFKDALDQIWCELEMYMKTIQRNQSVWFTGHSLGAAMAVVAADRWLGARGLYTFGCPGIGDNAFLDDFPINSNAYRFVNNNDGVTMVASNVLGNNVFGHVGQLKYIDTHGTIHDDSTFGDRLKGFFGGLDDSRKKLQAGKFDEMHIDHLRDHAPINYCVHLWNNLI